MPIKGQRGLILTRSVSLPQAPVSSKKTLQSGTLVLWGWQPVDVTDRFLCTDVLCVILCTYSNTTGMLLAVHRYYTEKHNGGRNILPSTSFLF